jgi:tetratricopeptide (TPR) repeat protein
MTMTPAHQHYAQHFPKLYHAIVNLQNDEPSEPMMLQEPSADTPNSLSLPSIFSAIETVIAQIESVGSENATLRHRILSLGENNRALEQKVHELTIKARNESPVLRSCTKTKASSLLAQPRIFQKLNRKPKVQVTFHEYAPFQPGIRFYPGISNSNLANIYVRQGKYFLDRRDYSAALLDMENALTINKNCADAHAYKAFAYQKIGEMTKSLEAAEQALLIMPYHHIAQQCKIFALNCSANSWNEILVPQQ